MTPRAELSFPLLLSVVLLLNCVPSDGLRTDWHTKLEQRRLRVQADMDLLIKYFCSHDQTDVNCQKRLPQLREELRHIDDQLLRYTHRDDERRVSVQEIYQPPPHDDRGLVDLIRGRNYVKAEQQLINQIEDAQNVVVDVYDKRSENFNLLVDFASTVRDAELKFLIYKFLLEEIIRRGHDDPMKVVRIIRGLQEEVVQANSIDDDTHMKAISMVDSLKLLFESAAAKLWIDSNINRSFATDSNIATLADEIYILDPELFTKIISRVVAALYPLTPNDELISNMERFHLVPQLIDAFSAIYSELERHGDINGQRCILKMGYYFRELMVRSNSSRIQISPEKKTKLQLMEQKLPLSVRSLIFGERVCLRNKHVHDYLHIAHGHPKLQRYAVMAPGTQLKWIPKVLEYSIFFEFPYGGFLFADDEMIGGHNRLVAASLKSDDMVVGSEWIMEPHGDDCFIKNVVYDELLYVGDEFDEDHRSYKVYTKWADAALLMNDDRFKWTIEECK